MKYQGGSYKAHIFIKWVSTLAGVSRTTPNRTLTKHDDI